MQEKTVQHSDHRARQRFWITVHADPLPISKSSKLDPPVVGKPIEEAPADFRGLRFGETGSLHLEDQRGHVALVEHDRLAQTAEMLRKRAQNIAACRICARINFLSTIFGIAVP